jgi:hypothetical protein
MQTKVVNRETMVQDIAMRHALHALLTSQRFNPCRIWKEARNAKGSVRYQKELG